MRPETCNVKVSGSALVAPEAASGLRSGEESEDEESEEEDEDMAQ